MSTNHETWTLQGPYIYNGKRVIASMIAWPEDKSQDESDARGLHLCACHNALNGLNPSAIPDAVKALEAWVKYDSDDSDDVTMMLNYANAIALTKVALAALKQPSPARAESDDK